MKILRFDDDRIGVLKNENSVIDITDRLESGASAHPQIAMEDLIGNFDQYRAGISVFVDTGDGVPLESVRLLPPIPRPSRCLAAFSNYLDTAERKAADVPEEFFYKDPDIVGPEGTVSLSDIPDVMVHQPEAELAYVMGKTGRNVTAENAMDHVFGYVGFFDISARGLTRRTQLIPKGQTSYAVCGPWITTSDEIPDPHDLQVKSWVSGEARQDYSTSNMAVKIPHQIAWLSRFIQLRPGDLIATGTFHIGLGPVNDGDVLEIDIEGIGRARFHVRGGGEKKLAEFQPGVTRPANPGGRLTRV
jgi:2-keto-4-pentenoate hydratase/2-oxohepta-3-ene-1,7-dioic acid hydratase in catechol pathway